MNKKFKALEMELMIKTLEPLLPHRDLIGYAAARNIRKLTDVLVEYFQFKDELIIKYGEIDEDGIARLNENSDKYNDFLKDFANIKDIEHEVDLMTLEYKEIIGILTGEEILNLDFMLKEDSETENTPGE